MCVCACARVCVCARAMIKYLISIFFPICVQVYSTALSLYHQLPAEAQGDAALLFCGFAQLELQQAYAVHNYSISGITSPDQDRSVAVDNVIKSEAGVGVHVSAAVETTKALRISHAVIYFPSYLLDTSLNGKAFPIDGKWVNFS